MESYVSFSNDAILDGAASLEGSLEDVNGVAIPRGALLASTGTPTEEVAEGPAPLEVATEEAAPTRKPLMGPTHPPVAVDNPTAEENGGSPQWLPWLDKSVTPFLASYHCRTNSPSPQWIEGETPQLECRGKESSASKGRRMPTNHGVASHVATWVPQTSTVACLWRDPLPMATIKAPMEPVQLEILVESAVATMCTSCIIQDETMGVTYMDMVATSMGRVALRSSHMVTCSPGPTIRGHHWPLLGRKDDNCL